ncbi:Cytochrome c oxidase subunit 4 [Malassezia nana]|uniref:Cytochrome c oxidase subunit 4 n=1 Tax=Malassezia nana TaxID=180528 RepID=A0AAF0J157_9BASI|nr:Cytochrome c oxidase subunit 4 [Malassezia nana]
MSFLRSSLTQSLRAPMRLAVAQRSAMAQRSAIRGIAISPLRLSEHHAPVIQGPGAKEGTVASDEDQSTGIERFELMGRLQGIDVFDMTPLESDRLGTVENPIIVKSMVRVDNDSKD